MKHHLDATLCRFYFCRVTLHVSGTSANHQEYLKLVQRNWFPALIRRCDDLPATITHVPVAAVLVLNTPDDGRLRPKRVEWLCRNKTCIVLHQVGVSFELYYDARKHKIQIPLFPIYLQNPIWLTDWNVYHLCYNYVTCFAFCLKVQTKLSRVSWAYKYLDVSSCSVCQHLSRTICLSFTNRM